MLMKSLSPQYPTSLGHVEALELMSARTYTFSYGMSEHQIKQQQNTHIWLIRIKLSCRKSCNPNSIFSRHMANIALCPGIYWWVPSHVFICISALLAFKNARNFVGIYLRLTSLPSFTGIMTNYKTCKDWNGVYDTHIKMVII